MSSQSILIFSAIIIVACVAYDMHFANNLYDQFLYLENGNIN